MNFHETFTKASDLLFYPTKIICEDSFASYDEKSKLLKFGYWHSFNKVLPKG
jgi:hypothetical protein